MQELMQRAMRMTAARSSGGEIIETKHATDRERNVIGLLRKTQAAACIRPHRNMN